MWALVIGMRNAILTMKFRTNESKGIPVGALASSSGSLCVERVDKILEAGDAQHEYSSL